MALFFSSLFFLGRKCHPANNQGNQATAQMGKTTTCSCGRKVGVPRSTNLTLFDFRWGWFPPPNSRELSNPKRQIRKIIESNIPTAGWGYGRVPRMLVESPAPWKTSMEKANTDEDVFIPLKN